MSDNYSNYFNSKNNSTDQPAQYHVIRNPNANVVRATRTNKANVPADLCSAGIEYKDLFNPITSYLASPHTFNANLALDFSLLTS